MGYLRMVIGLSEHQLIFSAVIILAKPRAVIAYTRHILAFDDGSLVTRCSGASIVFPTHRTSRRGGRPARAIYSSPTIGCVGDGCVLAIERFPCCRCRGEMTVPASVVTEIHDR